MKVLVAQSYLTLGHPMDCSHQAPLSVGFCRHEYWSGLSCSVVSDSLQSLGL